MLAGRAHDWQLQGAKALLLHYPPHAGTARTKHDTQLHSHTIAQVALLRNYTNGLTALVANLKAQKPLGRGLTSVASAGALEGLGLGPLAEEEEQDSSRVRQGGLIMHTATGDVEGCERGGRPAPVFTLVQHPSPSFLNLNHLFNSRCAPLRRSLRFC